MENRGLGGIWVGLRFLDPPSINVLDWGKGVRMMVTISQPRRGGGSCGKPRRTPMKGLNQRSRASQRIQGLKSPASSLFGRARLSRGKLSKGQKWSLCEGTAWREDGKPSSGTQNASKNFLIILRERDHTHSHPTFGWGGPAEGNRLRLTFP